MSKDLEESLVSEKSKKDILSLDIILNSITSVQLELSNLCNFSLIHKKCLAYASETKQGKIILPKSVVKNAINLLTEHHWDGTNKEIKFHEYNEPTIDPRLFMFINYTRKHLPTTNIMLWSNGYYITDVILLEMIEEGINRFRFTAYNDSEWIRLNKLKEYINTELQKDKIIVPNKLQVYMRIDIRKELDDRLTRLKEGKTIPCYALKNLSMRASGAITICCMDIYAETPLGNVRKEDFKTTLINNAKRRLTIKEELESGKSILDLCKGCYSNRNNGESVQQKWQEYKIG